MFAAARPMGQFSMPHIKIAAMTLATVQMELEKHKMMSMVMTEAYLDVLNK